MSATESRQVIKVLLSEALLHLDKVERLMTWYEEIWEKAKASPQYVYEIDGTVYASDLCNTMANATDEISYCVADARGWNTEMLEGAPIAGFADLVRALREPFPIATIIAAVCAALGVTPPEEVAEALKDCEPLPPPWAADAA